MGEGSVVSGNKMDLPPGFGAGTERSRCFQKKVSVSLLDGTNTRVKEVSPIYIFLLESWSDCKITCEGGASIYEKLLRKGNVILSKLSFAPELSNHQNDDNYNLRSSGL